MMKEPKAATEITVTEDASTPHMQQIDTLEHTTDTLLWL